MQLAQPPEVPAFVQHENKIENHVKVQGGTNWDFSRSAVTTPIVALPDPAPTKSPGLASVYKGKGFSDVTAYVATIEFSRSSAAIPLSMQNILKSLPRAPTYSVIGHSGAKENGGVALRHKREKAVLALMRKNGNIIKEPFSGSPEVPRGTAIGNEQKVDVFISF